MVDTLILHGGGPKTGSSYLQHVLAINQTKLLEHGILYPEASNVDKARRGETTSGNGLELASYINRDLHHCARSRETALDRLCEQLDRRDIATLVLSSEFLALLANDYTEQLYEACARRDVRMCYLFYVRHISAAAYSAYCQRLKKRVETRTLTEFIQRWPGALYLQRLQDAASVIPRDNILCYNYDAFKDRLAAHLFEGILKTRNYLDSEATVNRSLSITEAEFLRKINSRLTSETRASAHLATILLQKNRPPSRPVVWTPQEKAILESRFAEKVDAINAFVTGEPVHVLAPEAEIGGRPNVELSEWDEIVVALLAGLSERQFSS